MNLLDLVPSYKRYLKLYVSESDTDSTLAAYLADGVEAMSNRWNRTYAVALTAPMTFEVTPDIVAADKRPIIVMSSILYKMGNTDLASWTDGDFSYHPTQNRIDTITLDIQELDKMVLPSTKRLATGFTEPIRGFANIYNPESYSFILRWYP